MGSLLGIGAGAGFVSALLFAVVTTGNPLAIILYLVAPLPVLLAALGWNHRAGLAAAVAGTCMIGLAFSIPAGLLYLLSVAGAGLVVRLPRAPRAHRGQHDGMVSAWAAPALDGRDFVGADVRRRSDARDRLRRVRGPIRARDRPDRTDQSRIRSRASVPKDGPRRQKTSRRLIATVAPPLSAAISVGSSVLLVWLAAKIVGKSGRLPRPWPQISLVELPRSGLMVLGAALLASVVLTGFGGLLARSVGAAALMAYCLQGLAVIHVLTKSVSGRTGILFAVYFTFLVLSAGHSCSTRWPVSRILLFGLRARKLAGARTLTANCLILGSERNIPWK